MVLDKPTVFVIDDDAPVRRTLPRLLRAAGYDAEGLDTPAAYLQRAAPTPPACLVLDVRMPGMSGLELHEKVRGTPHALPTVFITGHSDAELTIPFPAGRCMPTPARSTPRSARTWARRPRCA